MTRVVAVCLMMVALPVAIVPSAAAYSDTYVGHLSSQGTAYAEAKVASPVSDGQGMHLYTSNVWLEQSSDKEVWDFYHSTSVAGTTDRMSHRMVEDQWGTTEQGSGYQNNYHDITSTAYSSWSVVVYLTYYSWFGSFLSQYCDKDVDDSDNAYPNHEGC